MEIALIILASLIGLGICVRIVSGRKEKNIPQRQNAHTKLEVEVNAPLPIIVHFQNMALPDAKIAMITERHFQHLFSMLGHSIPNFGNELSCHSCFLPKKPYLIIEYGERMHILPCDAFSSHPFGTPSSWEQALLISQATAQNLGVSSSSETALLKKFVLLCPNDADTLRYIADQQNKARGIQRKRYPPIDIPGLGKKFQKELNDILNPSSEEENNREQPRP